MSRSSSGRLAVMSANGMSYEKFDSSSQTNNVENLAHQNVLNEDSLNPTVSCHYEQERQILLRA
jgi:hypothetical protein